MNKLIIGGLAAFALIGAAHAQKAPAPKVDPAKVEVVIKGTWKKPADGWQARIDQDETQKICSDYRIPR
jgi:L-cysteine S-thiosulfotransferase